MIAEQIGALTAMYVEGERGNQKSDPLIDLNKKN